MNRLIIYIVIISTSSFLLGCNGDKETEGVSRTTFFPTFETEGNDLVITSPNDTYVDTEVTATEDGVQLEVITSVSGRYSGYSGTEIGAGQDEYVFTYTAINGDGFPGSSTRTVAKIETGDFVNSISGLYHCNTLRSTGEVYDNIVLLWETDTDVYEFSCLVGGFYGDGRGFGDGFLCRGGTVTVNDLSANDFSFGQGQFPVWGNTVDVQSMIVDAATKTINFNVLADFGGVWDMTMVQMQPEDL